MYLKAGNLLQTNVRSRCGAKTGDRCITRPELWPVVEKSCLSALARDDFQLLETRERWYSQSCQLLSSHPRSRRNLDYLGKAVRVVHL